MKNESSLIRNSLKQQGFNNRQVSVVQSSISSVYVTIKDYKVNFKKVKEEVEKFEKVRHCPHTGEILSGGNLFVFVSYDGKTVKQYAEANKELLTNALEKAKSLGSSSFELGNKKFVLFKNKSAINDYCNFTLYIDGSHKSQFITDISNVAHHILTNS
jgi:hypothetical protein